MTDARLALSDAKGPLKDLLDKLCSDEWRQWDCALKRFLRKENPWDDALPDLDWEQTYKLLLGVEGWKKRGAEVTKLLASHTDRLEWPILVLKGVTCNKVVQVLRELGVTVWTYIDDLDKGVPTNDRSAKKKAYCVSVKKRVEADEEFKNLSANDLKKQKVTGVTLLERLLLELAYFMSTGMHLDVENWTLCSGSRYSDGYVPYVLWLSGDRKVRVGWYNPDDRYDFLRARAVSISTPA